MKKNGQSAFQKFLLLFWKNWLLHKRHKVQTLVEILVPIIFTAIVLGIRSLVKPDFITTNTVYDQFDPAYLPERNFSMKTLERFLNFTKLFQNDKSARKLMFGNLFGNGNDLNINDLNEIIESNISTIFKNLNRFRSKDQSLDENFNIEKLFKSVFDNPEFSVKNLVSGKLSGDGKNNLPVSSLPPGLLNTWLVPWAPFNPVLDKVMSRAGTKLQFFPVPFETVEQMISNMTIPGPVTPMLVYLAGVVFDDSLVNITELPLEIDITIRFPGESRFVANLTGPESRYPGWRTNLLFPLFQLPGPRQKTGKEGGLPGYYREGFLGVQHAVSESVIELHQERRSARSLPPIEIMMRRYPYPPYTDDILLTVLENFLPLVILLSYVYSCSSTVKMITTEKEKQLKESMKMMGLPNWLHWTAWFVQLIIIFTISMSVIVLLLKAPIVNGLRVLPHTDWTCLWTFLFVYMLASITFCFAVSVFFSSANTGSIVAGLLWFLSFFPYAFIQQNYEHMTFSEKLYPCVFFNTAMSHGLRLVIMYDDTGGGLQWSNFFTPMLPDDSFTMGHVCGALLLMSVVHMVVALYVEGVKPGKFGVPLPWYFPFTRSYWLDAHKILDTKTFVNHDADTIDGFFEPEPKLVNPGIQIKHLRKVYSNNKVAVSDLNLNMYEGQITVLLGHNGAGKTTTMSMLTGLFPPTSGTALVGGHDIRTNIRGVRETLGLCPQHNVLFDELTVREHVQFFGKLKGLSSDEINGEADKYVRFLELEDKVNSPAGTLSGGMQRKLAVAVALCGNSKVVLLDEPTSGMDPGARRCLWDLLQNEKVNRTILLTTHFMDEADLLGDRIAIMSGGQLKCCGSSFFLKKRYGNGYRLTMVKKPECVPDKVTTFLNRYLEDVVLSSNVGSELSYYLDENKSSVFEEMFGQLETSVEELGIISYGVSLTTMEDVFMKAGGEPPEERYKPNSAFITNGVNHNENVIVNIAENDGGRGDKRDELLTGWSLTRNQIKAMFFKYVTTTVRAWPLYLIVVVIPIVNLSLAITTTRTFQLNKNLPPRLLGLKSYSGGSTFIQKRSDEEKITNLTDKLHELLSRDQLVDKLNMSVDVEKYLIGLSANEFSYRLQRTGGAVIEGDRYSTRITGHFNNQPYHMPATILNYVHNAIAQTLVNPGIKINIINYPLPYTQARIVFAQQTGANMAFQVAFNLGFSFSFIASYFILYFVRERVSKAKLLQVVSGVSAPVFWTTAYCWNFVSILGPVAAVLVTLAVFQEDGLSGADELGRIFSLLICFSFAALPVMYLASFLFSIPATGFTRMTMVNIFTGVAFFIIVAIMQNPIVDLKDWAEVLDWIFTFLPSYSLSYSFRNLVSSYVFMKLCKPVYENSCRVNPEVINVCCKVPTQCPSTGCLQWTEDYYDWESPGVGRNVFFLVLDGVMLFTLLLLLEGGVFNVSRLRIPQYKKNKEQKILCECDDGDVLDEREKIQLVSDVDGQQYNLLIQNVTKYYGKFLAVNQICLGVNKGECFGLLGVNGAGKTSLFKMLTGDEKITFGDVYVHGLSVKCDKKKVDKLIGYCPQFDALINDLTGRETLKIFCLLRGVQPDKINQLTEKLAVDLLFKKHLDKKVQEYSGGNKRKLSTALALVGDPPVIYLDEPTTGMDPVAKRHLWNVICDLRNSGKTIILTSHSMEECEALCTRLAIMVNGEFKCLGSTQHLKNKFAQGYTLTVKVRKRQDDRPGVELVEEDLDGVKKYIEEKFLGAELKEAYQGLLTYYIPDPQLTWSRMFGLMESAKKKLNIEDYSLGQTSLEQVFLSFTKYQRQDN